MEGLLTGNINLLKPASCDYPVSRFLLKLLAEEEPRLAPYIHIFRIPSSCPEKLRKLARMADAAVIWGGMDAVRSVRSLLSPGQKLIEWGHKISFAYVTMEGASTPLDLFRLARHMFLTQGRYCSSCQGIFLDTDGRRIFGHSAVNSGNSMKAVPLSGRILNIPSLRQPENSEFLLRFHEDCFGRSAFRLCRRLLDPPPSQKPYGRISPGYCPHAADCMSDLL